MEENKYSKFVFNVFLSLIVFFYAGIVGVITSVLHIIISCVILALDIMDEEREDNELAKELDDL